MSPSSQPASLPALLTFSAFANLATAIATVGVFFLAESAYGFSTAENYQLGLLLGITYALASWKAGALLGFLARRLAGISGRAALLFLSLAMASLCLLPYLHQSKGSIYLFVTLYSPLTGIFWSLVESFLSGGRSGEGLRRALGAFNVTWSGFMSISMWVIAPLVDRYPLEILLGVAVMHLTSLIFLPRFPRDPARHVEHSQSAPAHYAVLLRGHQVLLVASYLIMFALSPYLPELMRELHVAESWRTALGSIWMPVRVLVFFVLGRWHGWHGKRGLGIFGSFFLLAGFALTVLAPELGAQSLGLLALVLGQLLFGIAIAALYTANLYYTMAVGQASLEASGSHEGLIGLGYTIGPLCGWVAGGLAAQGLLPAEHVNHAILLSIEALGFLAVALAWKLTRKRPF